MMHLTTATWRKSSRSSAAGGNCVEVANLATAVAVRDSKDPAGGVLTFPRQSWTAFVAGIKRGDYDH